MATVVDKKHEYISKLREELTKHENDQRPLLITFLTEQLKFIGFNPEEIINERSTV